MNVNDELLKSFVEHIGPDAFYEFRGPNSARIFIKFRTLGADIYITSYIGDLKFDNDSMQITFSCRLRHQEDPIIVSLCDAKRYEDSMIMIKEIIDTVRNDKPLYVDKL